MQIRKGAGTREETVNNIIKTLGSIQKSDGSPSSFNNLLMMLLSDVNMQECLNNYRIKLGLPVIDFANVSTLEDLKPFNISYDQLLDSLNNLRIEEMEMDSPDGKWNTYAEEKALAQARGFDEREGVNVLVYEASHDYLKDMQTQQKRKCYPSMADSS